MGDVKARLQEPGVYPPVWSSISNEHQERIKLIFESQKRGTFAVETDTYKPDEDPSNWGLRPGDMTGEFALSKFIVERECGRLAAVAKLKRHAAPARNARAAPRMPIQSVPGMGVKVLTERELHRDHIPDIVPCFNQFADKVYVYAGGMPSRYADTDPDGKGRLVETQLLTPDVHGWYKDFTNAMTNVISIISSLR